jgi:DnaK suppressor protein
MSSMPATREELTDGQRADIRARLEAVAQELRSLVRDDDGLTDTVVLDQSRMGRISRVDALQHQQMAAAGRRRAEARLKRVHAAIERFDEAPDEYDWCPGCGEPIGYPRLKAVPETVFCVPCLQARGR